MTVLMQNGRFLSGDEPIFTLESRTVQFGYGVFETLQINANGPILPVEHISRLMQGCVTLGLEISYSPAEIIRMIDQVVERSQSDRLRLKVIASSEGISILSYPLEVSDKWAQGLKLKSFPLQRSLPEIKSLSYLDCLKTFEEATTGGFDEALLYDSNGLITEGARSNVFWIDGETIRSRENNVLPGIVRDWVMKDQAARFQFESITLNELIRADGVFITNSIMGIVPILSVDGLLIGNGNPHKMVMDLKKRWQQQFDAL